MYVHSLKPLRHESLRSDLHLHALHRVAGSMPSVPGDAVRALLIVRTKAVVHAVQVRVGAAVVPVAT